jgi:hypothetical protein
MSLCDWLCGSPRMARAILRFVTPRVRLFTGAFCSQRPVFSGKGTGSGSALNESAANRETVESQLFVIYQIDVMPFHYESSEPVHPF